MVQFENDNLFRAWEHFKNVLFEEYKNKNVSTIDCVALIDESKLLLDSANDELKFNKED